MLSSKSNVVPLVMNIAVLDGTVDMPPERQDVTKVIIISSSAIETQKYTDKEMIYTFTELVTYNKEVQSGFFPTLSRSNTC